MNIGLKSEDTEAVSSDEILNFQKAAIYRQCMEYKRLYLKESNNLQLINDKITNLELVLSRVLNLANLNDPSDLNQISNLEQLQNSVIRFWEKSTRDFVTQKNVELHQQVLSLQRKNETLTTKNDEIFSLNMQLSR